jgi:ribosomal-protein-alanine N-acetyltransferase
MLIMTGFLSSVAWSARAAGLGQQYVARGRPRSRIFREISRPGEEQAVTRYRDWLVPVPHPGGSADDSAEEDPMTADLPPWPADPPAYGPVVLRGFADGDVPMVRELSTDPYVPLIGSLRANASQREAQDWIDRQRGRLAEGAGFSFAVAEADTGRAVAGTGLWLAALAHGRATAGYSVAPSARGRGLAAAALIALTHFAWTIPALHRIELYIEPWNTGSVKTAERAGYEREGLLRSHQEIGGQRRDMLLYAIIREPPAA